MKLITSKSIVRGFLDEENEVFVDHNHMKASNSKISTSTVATTTTASICSSSSPSSIYDDETLSFSVDYHDDDSEDQYHTMCIADNDTNAADRSDKELLSDADWHAKHDRILAAAGLLRKVKDDGILQRQHLKLLKKGYEIEQMLMDHLPNPEEDGWKLQFESHTGKQDVTSYYKLDENDKMTARVEIIIPEPLAVLVAAILFEVEMWHTWMPRFTFPAKMGFGETTVLEKIGRSTQLIEANLDLPWPIASRVAYAEISLMDLTDDNGMIVATVKSPSPDDVVLPEQKEGIERIDFDVGLVMKKCPADYPGLVKSKQKKNCKENMLLITANASISPSINLFTRTFFGPMFISLLRLAERVRDGKLQQYDNVMGKYEWLRDCLQNMLSKNVGK